MSSARLQTLYAPLYSFELVGRLAMDFGFGAFLEKFEEYFGRTATRILLVVFGATLMSWCAKTVFSDVAYPIFQAVSGGLNNEPAPIARYEVRSALVEAISLGMACILMIVLVSTVRRMLNRDYRTSMLADELNKITKDGSIDSVEKVLALNRDDAIELAISQLKSSKNITPETVETIRSRLGIGSGTPL